VTGLALVLLLLATGSPEQQQNDAGTSTVLPPTQHSVEDQEVIQNMELLESMAENQALDLLLELDPDSPDSGGG